MEVTIQAGLGTIKQAYIVGTMQFYLVGISDKQQLSVELFYILLRYPINTIITAPNLTWVSLDLYCDFNKFKAGICQTDKTIVNV